MYTVVPVAVSTIPKVLMCISSIYGFPSQFNKNFPLGQCLVHVGIWVQGVRRIRSSSWAEAWGLFASFSALSARLDTPLAWVPAT